MAESLFPRDKELLQRLHYIWDSSEQAFFIQKYGYSEGEARERRTLTVVMDEPEWQTYLKQHQLSACSVKEVWELLCFFVDFDQDGQGQSCTLDRLHYLDQVSVPSGVPDTWKLKLDLYFQPLSEWSRRHDIHTVFGIIAFELYNIVCSERERFATLLSSPSAPTENTRSRYCIVC